MSVYREPGREPETLGWYVVACEHPFMVTGQTWEVFGPYRWRWWARVIAWTFGDYGTVLVSRYGDERAVRERSSHGTSHGR